MTTIQDFLDEKNLEGVINGFLETDYDKVMTELTNTTSYTIHDTIFGVESSTRNNVIYNFVTDNNVFGVTHRDTPDSAFFYKNRPMYGNISRVGWSNEERDMKTYCNM